MTVHVLPNVYDEFHVSVPLSKGRKVNFKVAKGVLDWSIETSGKKDDGFFSEDSFSKSISSLDVDSLKVERGDLSVPENMKKLFSIIDYSRSYNKNSAI